MADELTMREKLIELLYKAHGLATEASCFEDATYAQQLEVEADYIIAHGVGFLPRWIPVTEMVPESHVERMDDLGETLYYVCSDFVLGYTDHGQFVCVQHLVEDEKDYWIDDFGTEYTVTHWMPLPEKPEGE